MAPLDCRSCHTESGFAPSRFTVAKHDARFVLSGPHRNVACPECHLAKMGTALRDEPAKRAGGFRAKRVISQWRMRAPGLKPDQCERCHRSPHRDQFVGACLDCHAADTFSIQAFDHTAMTAYPLEGQHRKVACDGCHFEETDGEGRFVRYSPRAHDDCVDCHDDEHAGQFRVFEPALACSKCHVEKGFKPALFEHNKATFSDFPLNGAHQKVACGRCHQKVSLKDIGKRFAYRNTPKNCEACHADPHDGAYRNAAQLISSGVFARSVSTESRKPGKTNRTTACATCHEETGWLLSTFNHGITGFDLKGRHQQLACEKCHVGGLKTRLPITCEGCHRDPHQGTAGVNCAECHSENDFRDLNPSFPRHSQTRFPLVGRHGVLPCTECHQNVRDLRFDQTPQSCDACHMDDIPGAGGAFNHSTSGTDCKRCHTPTSWGTAGYAGHERCFNIGTFTHHGTISCQKCHQGTLPEPNGSCDDATFSCTQCHGCQTSRHSGVSGYACEERRCASCHKDA